MKPSVAIALLLAVLSLSACGGESAEEQAQASVCDARVDISEEVDKLKGMSIATATTSEIRDSLTAIRGDLAKIKDVQADLGDERKSQVREANEAFESQVRALVASVGTTTSPSDAKSQLGQALDQLADTYQATFAKVDCG